MKRTTILAAGVLVILLAAAISLAPQRAVASNWCGENGVVKLRFGETADGPATLEAVPDTLGFTRVLVTAWLTEVEPVAVGGEAVLQIGGYEMQLQVTGAEPLAVRKLHAEGIIDLAREPLGCLVGLNGALDIVADGVKLVTWEIVFQGEVGDVGFVLQPEGILTCATTEGCQGSGTRALYIGSADARQLAEVFGAGCAPAWLNPTEEPDLTVQRGSSSWRDVGRLTARQTRF